MGTEWIAPTISGVLLLVISIVGGIISLRNNRSSAVESRAPSASQAWNETDRARERMHAFEDLFYTVRAALKNLVRAVSRDHPDYVLTKDVIDAMQLEPPDEDSGKKEKN